MKASPRQQTLLLTLQDLDTTIARLHRKRATLGERDQLQALAGELGAVRDRFMQAQRELDTRNAELERIESDVTTVQQRRERDMRMLEHSTVAKEAQALQSELDTLAKRQGDLEDRQLALMEQVEEAQAAYDAAQEELNGVDARRAQLQAELDAAEARIDREIQSNSEERAGLSAEIQGDLIGLYEELRGRIGTGAARLRGNVSEGSNMALAPAELSEIRQAAPDEIIFCPGSGVILVRDFDAVP